MLAAVPTEACGLAVTTLVVVDGGDDRTDEIAKESGAVTFVLSENLGHGYALRVGYALCIELGAQYVVTLDADGQNDPAEIPVMLQPLVDDEADFVVASRRPRAATPPRTASARPGVRVFSWTMSAMGHTKLTDTSNGYRALRVSMLDDIAYRLIQPQYQTAELLIIAMKRGWRVTERPTVWLPRASGTTKKGKNWLFGFRYGRVVPTPGGSTGAPSRTQIQPELQQLRSWQQCLAAPGADQHQAVGFLRQQAGVPFRRRGAPVDSSNQGWSDQRAFASSNRRRVPSRSRGPLFEGLRIPFGSLNREEVATVDVERYSELTAGVGNRMDCLVTEDEDLTGREFSAADFFETVRSSAEECIVLLAAVQPDHRPHAVVVGMRAIPGVHA